MRRQRPPPSPPPAEDVVRLYEVLAANANDLNDLAAEVGGARGEALMDDCAAKVSTGRWRPEWMSRGLGFFCDRLLCLSLLCSAPSTPLLLWLPCRASGPTPLCLVSGIAAGASAGSWD